MEHPIFYLAINTVSEVSLRMGVVDAALLNDRESYLAAVFFPILWEILSLT